MEVVIDEAGVVLQYGNGLAPTGPTQTLREIADAEAAKLDQPGVKTLAADGTIAVTPRVPTPEEVAAEAAVAADLAARQALAAQLETDLALLQDPNQPLSLAAAWPILARLVGIALVAARTMDRRGA